MLLMFVEVVRRKDSRDHGNVRLQLNLHEAIHHGLCHELVTVDPTVHNQSRGNGRVSTRLRKSLGMEWKFECPRHPEKLHSV